MLEELRARFRTRFIDTARDRIRRSLGKLGESSSAVDIAGELHSLAGEAAMLGFDAISLIARNGEAAARRWHAGSTAAQVECARIVRTLGREIEALSDTVGPMAAPGDVFRGRVPGRATGSAQRVLVVDDSRLAGEELAESLGDAGFDVRIAADRDTAVRELDGFAPALVLTDVQMPGVAPAAMCRALRAAAPGPVMIMLMSGRTDAELASLARSADADGFISKQHGTDHIVAHVRRALQEAVS
jgi:CheY-like chemotaxis protein/HPt (histidine-containing phosphotransfer) domain-containing protein